MSPVIPPRVSPPDAPVQDEPLPDETGELDAARMSIIRIMLRGSIDESARWALEKEYDALVEKEKGTEPKPSPLSPASPASKQGEWK